MAAFLAALILTACQHEKPIQVTRIPLEGEDGEVSEEESGEESPPEIEEDFYGVRIFLILVDLPPYVSQLAREIFEMARRYREEILAEYEVMEGQGQEAPSPTNPLQSPAPSEQRPEAAEGTAPMDTAEVEEPNPSTMATQVYS